MKNVDTLKCGNYKVSIGSGYFSSIPHDIKSNLKRNGKCIIVSDTNVFGLYGIELENNMKNSKLEYVVYTIQPGESSKNGNSKRAIENFMFENEIQRDGTVIAFGGGVVGDLAGFVAATYMRGIGFIQIPTSLLAMVDSSIGGKTGIDNDYGKNLVGAFHQPLGVYIVLDLLKSLPMREFKNGMGEIIKAGAIRDEVLFQYLEDYTDEILNLNMEKLKFMIIKGAGMKVNVVNRDEKEHGIRAILNFGHSIGHGMEALLQPEYLHGECVAIGMIKEAEIARYKGFCTPATLGRLIRCIKAFGLPTRVPEKLNIHQVLLKMAVDKKNANGVKRMIMLNSIGSVACEENKYVFDVSDKEITTSLEKQIMIVPGNKARGTLRVPGSKSISNRILLLTAMGDGECRITGLLHSDDTQVMIGALQILGAGFKWEQNGSVLVVTGTGGKFNKMDKQQMLYLSNAGTAYRFLTTAANLVPKEQNGSILLTGNYRMKERPIGPLVDALRQVGCNIEYAENEGYPPLIIEYDQGLVGGTLNLAGKISSQYVSSVLLAAPYAASPVVLKLQEEHPTSLPYILMTTALMQQFGIKVEQRGSNEFIIPSGTSYVNPPKYDVEVDASSATYPLAMAAITAGSITVQGLGCNSTQGDADFHSLLTTMGCTTKQTENTTSVVSAPKVLSAIDCINMENMTDAFMTAIVLAAVANGTTKIVGISNQRVKECNRIQVMVTELSKLGFECGELDDGIWIKGNPNIIVQQPTTIQCHNDHRIAMSFAVLGCVVNNIIISDKECTDKTYPEFWDDCQLKLGLLVEPITKTYEQIEVPVQTVFVIGMRGCGKSTVSKAAAGKLQLNFKDMDLLLENEVFKTSVKEYVNANGWKAFRNAEFNLLRQLIRENDSNTLIACGGGIIESPECVQLLQEHKHVIHMQRDWENVRLYLSSQEMNHRPELDEEVDVLWSRRRPFYQRASSHEFKICENIATNSNQFAKFLQYNFYNRVNSMENCRQLCTPNTFFLSLTFPSVEYVKDLFPKITSNVQAVELRVDLLASQEEEFILSEICVLREITTLPIIYTVRSEEQGGSFTGNEDDMFRLLNLGVRAGCEFVDMECSWSLKCREELIRNKKSSLIIGSFHAIHSPSNDDEIANLYQTCYHNGRVDIVKVVLKAFDNHVSYRVYQIGKAMDLSVPIIALCTTENGKLSRVINPILTPVTHPLLPKAAAPGQLSVDEIVQLRSSLGLWQSKQC